MLSIAARSRPQRSIGYSAIFCYEEKRSRALNSPDCGRMAPIHRHY
jgi:hypothetical protein